MSGDVQPRKRKDKKKKKDDYTGLAPPAEEKPTHVHTPASSHSSSEGGVVIMHAQHDHGTGGHWCAKLVFFILLGILVGLIGLIILENRGLTDLDTPNSESRYAAVFDGWVDEGSPDDHHHDKHTFELTHPDDSDDHDNADEAHKVSEEQGSEEQQDDGSDEKEEDSNDEADDNSEEQDNEDSEEDADEDSEREEDDNSEEDSNDVSEEDKDDGVSDEQLEDNSADQADEQSQEQGDQNSDEQDDEEDNASKEDDNEASNEQDDTGSNEQDNEDSNEEDNEDSNERNDDSAEQNEDNSAEQNDDDSAEQNDGDSTEENDGDSEERNLQEESKETNDDNDDSDQDNEEQDGGDLSDQENDVELEDIVKETDTQAASEGSKEKDVSDDEGGNESEIDDIQDDFSDIEEQISDYAKEDFQEEFLEDEVEQEGGESVHREDKPYEELDSAEEVVVDNAAGEQEYEERKAKEQQAAEEETSNRKPEGGLSVEAWADEPTDSQWRHQLDLAQAELDEGKVDEARDKYLRVLRVAPKSTRALWGYARSLDVMAERKKSNEILNAAIAAYNNLLNLGPALSDKLFKDVANRTINRIRFKGNALLAEPVHKLLIERFDAEPKHRNDLAICYLMSNNPHKARLVLKETLQRWPNDGVALVHHGFILKTVDGKLEEAVTYLQRGIDTGDEGTLDGRFFFQLGDALLMLGRKKEADEVHKMGSLKGIFLSPEQRSLYNVDRLLGRPWWNVDQTPYSNLVNDLERHWREILKEAVSMADEYGAEKEGLKSKGQWTQLELFTRGREIPGRCKKAPVTCTIVRKEAAAKNCRRGQIKFSALTPGTHIRPHVGPTNCRLRSHLGLTNTEGAYLRVHNETRKWHEGKVFIFDDSFEHEVWHNGTGTRIVLIVDLWHPGLTALERSALPAI